MASTLRARPRAKTESGKGAARKLRRAGQVPAVSYGHGDETRVLTVDAHELELLLAAINPATTIIDLQVEGGVATPALIREVQYHPVRPVILHVDFYQVHAGEKLHVSIPIRVHGTPIGVREGDGILQEVIREVSVECLPKDIPAAFDIDVGGMNIGDSLHISDLSLPNVTILNDPELVICTVTTPTLVVLPEDEAAEVEAAEPEVIRQGVAEEESEERSDAAE